MKENPGQRSVVARKSPEAGRVSGETHHPGRLETINDDYVSDIIKNSKEHNVKHKIQTAENDQQQPPITT